jgi:hypothetical protein
MYDNTANITNARIFRTYLVSSLQDTDSPLAKRCKIAGVNRSKPARGNVSLERTTRYCLNLLLIYSRPLNETTIAVCLLASHLLTSLISTPFAS